MRLQFRALIAWAVLTSALPDIPRAQAADTTAPKAATPAVRAKPIARVKKSVICCPREKVYLDGWASICVGGEVSEWLWDLNGDGKPDTASTTGEMVLNAPKTSRTYMVVLRVKDKQGDISDPDTATVFVMDVGPAVKIRSDTTVKVGVRVPFDPVVTWVCGEPVKYEWDFGNDGTVEFRSSTTGSTSRVYYTPGTYYARFRVTDSYGKEAGVITSIHVTGSSARLTETATPAGADSLHL